MREIGISPHFSRDKFIPLQTKQRYSYFYTEGLSTSLLIDNIKIYDAVDNNLSAELDAPAHVQNGKKVVVK